MTATSTNTITKCACGGLTFMSDGLCSKCRNADKPKSEKPGEKR